MQAYLGLAAALALLCALIWLYRKRLTEVPGRMNIWRAFGLLRAPRFGWGALCIFLYVGAEVAIGSLIVNFLMQADVMGLGPEVRGQARALVLGGALVGRFIGAAILRVISPGKVLACVATGAIVLIAVSANAAGAVSGWALLAIGLCNSIMFPTIFSLASEELGERAAEGSGVICVAIVGGAVIPPLTGWLADLHGLRLSLLLPAACYAVIGCFGIYARRPSASLAHGAGA